MENVEGIPEQRRKQFGKQICSLIKEFCKTHNVSTDCGQKQPEVFNFTISLK